MPLIERAATLVYAACVDFELRAAALFGVSYRDVNAGLFFVLWPAVTLLLVVIVLWQRRALAACVAGEDDADETEGADDAGPTAPKRRYRSGARTRR